MSKEVTFIIGKEGEVRIDKLEGYGSGCLEATELLEKRLGGVDNSSRRMTEEYERPIQNESSGDIQM